MIVRSSLTPLKTDHHRILLTRISELQQENKQLRTQLLHLERQLLEKSSAKEKYKAKYRQAKQEANLLAMISHQKSPCRTCQPSIAPLFTPRKPKNPLHTFSSEELNSIRVGPISEVSSRIETRLEVQPVRALPNKQEEEKIISSLVRLHEQLDKLSGQIESQPVGRQTSLMQEQLYKKMQQVVDRMSRMEARDVQRDVRRMAHEKQQALRRQNARSLQTFAKDLADFKIAS